MASNLSGLFGGMTKSPEQYRQESIQGMRVSPAQMGQQGLYQQLISQMSNVGANIGSLAGGMMGGQTQQQAKDAQVKEVIQSVSNIASPLGQAQAAYQLFTDKGMTEEAQKTMGTIQALQDEADKKEMSDAQIAAVKAKTLSDLNSSTSTGAGTGPERMIMFIGSVRRRLAKGEDVPESEIAIAEDYMTQLGRQKSYTDTQGNVVTVSQSQMSPLRPPSKRPTQNPDQSSITGNQKGAVVTQTPEGMRNAKKQLDAAETQLAGLTQTLNNGQKIIDLYAEQGTGAFSSLNPLIVGVAEKVGGTKAKTASVARQSLEADKVIDTLLRMKSESKNGSTGFGALNIEELNQVKSQYQKLDPMSDNYIEDVKTYLKEVTRIRDKVAGIVSQMRGTPVDNKPAESKYNNEDIIKRAMAANPTASREAIVKALTTKGWLNN